MASLDFLLNPPGGGDQNQGPALLTVTWLSASICTIVVSLKLWTRFRIINQTGWDDALTVLALLFLLAFSGMLTASVHYGLGRHVYYLPPQKAMHAVKTAIISNPLAFLASAWPNISVAIALNRILVPTSWRRWLLYGIPIVQCMLAAICSVVTYTICIPLRGLWDPTVPRRCLSFRAVVGLLYFNGAFAGFTHIYLAAYPIFSLWKIQIRTRTKVGVCLLMSSTARPVHPAQSCRIALTWNSAAAFAVARTVCIGDALGTDFPYAASKLAILIVLETAFIIIAACIPNLRPFMRNLGHSLHLDFHGAKSLFIPKGYYHSHSRRYRPTPLVPRDSGSGATSCMASPRDKHEDGDEISGTASTKVENKEGTSTAANTPPSIAMTRESIQEKAEEADSQV